MPSPPAARTALEIAGTFTPQSVITALLAVHKCVAKAVASVIIQNECMTQITLVARYMVQNATTFTRTGTKAILLAFRALLRNLGLAEATLRV